ncbi:hypothetical protein NW757_013756 [Fusarium falciforme]|nr:hypothetical protein NW757_013756 [Fusarium falciforme]
MVTEAPMLSQSSSSKGLRVELNQFSSRTRSDVPYADNLDVDVLIVGVGFSGIYMLYLLRKQGLKVIVYDAVKEFGGVWHFNCYPSFRRWDERNLFDNTPEEREEFWESLWKGGGFHFWLANYKDYLFDLIANAEVYKFCYKKQSSRVMLSHINIPKSAIINTEQNCYEVIDRPDVELVNIAEGTDNEIAEFTKQGLRTTTGEYEFDAVDLATGFDAGSGGMVNIGLKSNNGTTLKDEWKDGAYTYLGLTISGFPSKAASSSLPCVM